MAACKTSFKNNLTTMKRMKDRDETKCPRSEIKENKNHWKLILMTTEVTSWQKVILKILKTSESLSFKNLKNHFYLHKRWSTNHNFEQNWRPQRSTIVHIIIQNNLIWQTQYNWPWKRLLQWGKEQKRWANETSDVWQGGPSSLALEVTLLTSGKRRQ